MINGYENLEIEECPLGESENSDRLAQFPDGSGCQV
jgi:hypothetical protein